MLGLALQKWVLEPPPPVKVPKLTADWTYPPQLRVSKPAQLCQCSIKPGNTHSIWKESEKLPTRPFSLSHIENVCPLLPFCPEKVEGQYIPLKLECSRKEINADTVNPTQEINAFSCKLILLPFWIYYEGQIFGIYIYRKVKCISFRFSGIFVS